MKWSLVGRAGALLSVLASSASAQSLTGSIAASNGGSYSTAGPNVLGLPVCNIGVAVVGECGFQFEIGNTNDNRLFVNGRVDQFADGSVSLGFSFNGAARRASGPVMPPNTLNTTFEFYIPIFTTGFNFVEGSSTLGYTLSRERRAFAGTSSMSNVTLDATLQNVAPAALDFGVLPSTITLPANTATQSITKSNNSGNIAFSPVAVNWFKTSVSFDVYSSNGNATSFSGSGGVDLVALSVVPEPSSVLLMASGMLGLVAVSRRRRSV